MTENYPSVPHKLMPGAETGVSSVRPGGERQYPPKPEALSPTSVAAAGAATPLILNRQKFVTSYANMVAKTWVDETFLDLLLANPAQTLAAAGLDFTEGAVFRIIQLKVTGMGTISDQVDKWLEGFRTGLYDLYLPMKPEDLEIDPGVGAADVNCCCTPCCCCT